MAKRVAQWMSIGFIHGVLNTDNMNLSGETIDFGPCAFMDEFKQDQVFSSIDHQGRYSFENQPLSVHFNLSCLAQTLTPFCEVEKLRAILDQFQGIFQKEFLHLMAKKLSVKVDDINFSFLKEWLNYLEENKLDWTLSHLNIEKCFASQENHPWFNKWKKLRVDHLTIYDGEKINPTLIPRNHQVERVIVRAEEHGDLSPLRDYFELLPKSYENTPEHIDWMKMPSENERVCQTFCGT
jgi:uncharacterized protein YdiU (UPF0061 family)